MLLQGQTHYGQNYRVLGGGKMSLTQKGRLSGMMREAQVVATKVAHVEVAALEAEADLTMGVTVTPCNTVAVDTGLWHMLHHDQDADVAWFLV